MLAISLLLGECWAGLRIRENKEVYEGEVTELTPEETLNATGGYGKVRGPGRCLTRHSWGNCVQRSWLDIF